MGKKVGGEGRGREGVCEGIGRAGMGGGQGKGVYGRRG